jgi:NitT/TauT family transport system permease protein
VAKMRFEAEWDNKNSLYHRLSLIFKNKNLMMGVSFSLLIAIWYCISELPGIKGVIIGPPGVFMALKRDIGSGMLMGNITVSMIRVIGGFLLSFAAALPAAFLMGWYDPVRVLVEPWIQFIRTIPPIALIPLAIVLFGIGTGAKIAIIFIACFMVMVITILQGVVTVDVTLIKAAYVLGACDRQIFFRVILPASAPFILVAARLGLATGLTTLIAAELTGATKGVGTMIMEASTYFNMDVVMEGIVVIGIIGFMLDKFILFLEKRLTFWQESVN